VQCLEGPFTMAPHPDVGEGAAPPAVRCTRAFLLPAAAPGRLGPHATTRAMTTASPVSAADIRARDADRALGTLRAASPRHEGLLQDAELRGRVARVAVASDFAIETLRRQASLLEHLAADDPPP